MSSENQGEEVEKDESPSENKTGDQFLNNQRRRNNSNSIESIGKSTKANQKGEEIPWCEVDNVIYRPGGRFDFLYFILIAQNRFYSELHFC